MKMTSKAASVVIPAVLAMTIAPAHGAITFLNHFNSNSSFDINPANGDFAGGDATATVSGSPSTGTGFFPGSSPANRAVVLTNGQAVAFNGYDGNINYPSFTSGGITVGAWVKYSSMAAIGTVFTLGNADLADDALLLDYGNGHTSIPRAYFRDGPVFGEPPLETGASVDATNWIYTAVTVDLTNSELKLFAFDHTGAAIPNTPVARAIPVSGWELNNPVALSSMIKIGGSMAPGTTLTVDEFSLDDQVLSDSAISARVVSMVAGNQLSAVPPSGDSEWANSAGGDWNVSSNWSNGTVPDGVGAKAVLGSGIGAPRTVFADTPITLGTLTFNNSNLYNLSGAASLSMQAASGAANIDVVAGSHKINLPLTFISDTTVSVAASSTLTLSDPVVIKAGKTVTRVGTGSLAIQAPLTIEGGGTLSVGPAAVSVLGVPNMGTNARIDVGAQSLIVDYHGQPNASAGVEAKLTTGYAVGAWSGEGIMTSSSTPTKGLGWVDDTANQTVKVKFTYYGDANLSGTVDSTDFNAMLAGYGQTAGAKWVTGDFNYDDKVNTLDFNHLAGNFGASPIPSPSLGAVVPEPTSGAVVALSALIGLRRRRVQ